MILNIDALFNLFKLIFDKPDFFHFLFVKLSIKTRPDTVLHIEPRENNGWLASKASPSQLD